MKPLKIISGKITTLAMLIAVVLATMSCGSNSGNSANNSEQAGVETKKVSPPTMDIHTATLMGDIEVIQQHIEAGSDLDVREPAMGSSPLISAAVFGKTDIAGELIKAGADVNLQNNEGSTALHSAAFLCRLEIAEMLLENGANKDLNNNHGSTALQSVLAPFSDVKFIYDLFSKDLGPLGFKLDYDYVEATRPRIAELLQ